MVDMSRDQSTSLSVSGTLASKSQPNSNNNNVTSLDLMTDVLQTMQGLASDDVRAMVEHVLDLWIGSFLSYWGIGANILNLLVFSKMGFQETINISLTFITVWDLLKCICFALLKLNGPIALVSPADAISWTNVTIIILGYLHTMAGYISGLMAGYVAVERCLCISMPFTVKFLLTQKVVVAANLAISLVTVGSYVCVYSHYTFHYQFHPQLNQTILVYRYQSGTPSVVYIDVISMLFVILSFAVICVCTWVISVQLRKSSKFRSGSSGERQKGDNSAQLSARDRQVIKMLLIVILVYMICFLPRVVLYLPSLLVPEFRPGRRYQNTMWIYVYVTTFFDLINASGNIFIYYKMSSQFKAAFKDLMRFGDKKKS